MVHLGLTAASSSDSKG